MHEFHRGILMFCLYVDCYLYEKHQSWETSQSNAQYLKIYGTLIKNVIILMFFVTKGIPVGWPSHGDAFYFTDEQLLLWYHSAVRSYWSGTCNAHTYEDYGFCVNYTGVIQKQQKGTLSYYKVNFKSIAQTVFHFDVLALTDNIAVLL
jgi:uncharacterized protein YifE (UPF0438 family)